MVSQQWKLVETAKYGENIPPRKNVSDILCSDRKVKGQGYTGQLNVQIGDALLVPRGLQQGC